MRAFQETTKWRFSNGTYLLDKERLVAYRTDSGNIQVFTRPLMFDRKGRTFQRVTDNELTLRGITGV